MALSQEEVLRYSRHLIMPEVGVDGQEKLKNASILLIGCGGLGSPLGMYLAAAGVGRLGLVDFDVVDFTNLQRQVMFGTADVGKPKVEASKERIAAINPNVQVTTYREKLSSANVMEIFKPYDIIIDGTDNFPTRYLVNDACVLLNKPNVYGSIFRFEGQATVFWAEKGPCYRCLYPEPPPPGMVPSCAEGGVLGILPGSIGLIQATEAIKLILHSGDPLIGRLLLFNALDMKFREVKLQKDPECPICGTNPTIKALIDYEQFCGIGLGQEEVAVQTNGIKEITAKELKAMIDKQEKFVLVDVREPHEYQIAKIPGAKLIPLGDVAQRANELDTADDIVVHCRSGARSAKAIYTLQKMGFKRLRNLKGGVLAWSQDVDPAFPSTDMDEKRYFTAREIDALVPRLEHIFGHIQTCKSRAEELAAQMLRVPESDNPADEVKAQLLHSQVEFLMSAVQDDIDLIEKMGAVIKDIEIGLVDFLGDVEGQDVWLCWKRGEPAVRFWHTLDSGYSQRRALRPVFPGGRTH